MAGPEDIRAILLRSKQEAKAQIDRIYACHPLDFGTLCSCLEAYVMAKYLLKREECEGVDFQALSELSMAKSMKISKDLVKEFDTARSCAGASSAMVKKVLLYMSLQKELHIELAAEKTPKLRDFTQLADLVWESMENTDYWKPRLAPR